MNYAWTMLVMSDINYFKGAYAVAKSLKLQNTIYPIILMVGNDIDPNYLELNKELLSIFDDIIIVPIIEHPILPFVSKRQKDIYGQWMSKSFTKWNCLTLTRYNKVILLDVDMLFVTNCDELFELNAPSACFSQPWAFPYCRDGAPNPYIKSNKKWLYEKNIPHGEIIRHTIIMDALVKKKHIESKPHSKKIYAKPSFSASAFIVLLQPNIEDYNLLLEIINSSPIYGQDTIISSEIYGLNTKINIYSISGADETSLSLLYAHRGINFTHIHQNFAATLWKNNWINNGEERIIHYFGQTKPWDMYVEEYPDLKIWWDMIDLLCSENIQYRQIYYPEYIPTLLDITVAEYNLTKEIQKMIVNKLSEIEFYKNKSKSELWGTSIAFVNSLLSPNSVFTDAIPQLYPKWSLFLLTEYPEHIKLPIAKIFITRYIAEIKKMVSNRLKIIPKQIKVEIKENEILCGNLKISKSREIATVLLENGDISDLLIAAIMRLN